MKNDSDETGSNWVINVVAGIVAILLLFWWSREDS